MGDPLTRSDVRERGLGMGEKRRREKEHENKIERINPWILVCSVFRTERWV